MDASTAEAAKAGVSLRSRSGSAAVQPLCSDSFKRTGVHKRTASGASSNYLNKLLAAQVASV